MKYLSNFLLIYFSIFSSLSFTQNLVPNGNFDTRIECPDWEDQMYKCAFWRNIPIHVGSPDFIHNCSNEPPSSAPNHIIGFQEPLSDSAYAGLFVYSTAQ